MTLTSDVGAALRSWRRSPVFAATAVLILTVGIGASTALFTVIRGALLRPLPFADPDRLVQVWELTDTGQRIGVPEANFYDWRAQSRSFTALALFSGFETAVVVSGRAVRVRASAVSAGYFDVLGVTPRLGRAPEARDHQNRRPLAVVSTRFWRNELGSTSRLETLPLTLSNTAFDIVGVLPPDLGFPIDTDVWYVREAVGSVNPSRSAHNFRVLGRLRPEVPIDAARAEISAIARSIRRDHAAVTAADATLARLSDDLTRDARPALVALAGAVLLLLLIACANVSNLLLTRSTGRARELAIRAALGASRARLVQLSIAEGLVLAALAGIAGTLVASISVAGLVALGGSRLPRIEAIHLDGVVVAFAAGLVALVGLALGTVSGWQMSTHDLQSHLKISGRTVGLPSARLRQMLVAGQLAVTVILLVGAGLLARSFWQLLHVDLGFRTERRLAVDLLAVPPRGDDDRRRLSDVHRSIESALAALPGADAVGSVNALPLSARGANGRLSLEGNADTGDYLPNFRVASPGYFTVLGVPLVRGRLLQESDEPDQPHVAVISERVAERVWPGQDPLGRRINFGNMDGDFDHWLTVVGIVGDIRHRGPASDPNGEIYLHYRQRPATTVAFTTVVRTVNAPEAMVENIRQRVHAIDPSMSATFRTLDELVSASTADRRFALVLLGAFGAAALVLAMLGVYGVVSYSVAQRTREMGVRLALGADSWGILRLVLREGARLTAAGIVVGIVGALFATRALVTLLFGVPPIDLVSLAGAAGLLAIVATLAAGVPALRAARVDPLVALRD